MRRRAFTALLGAGVVSSLFPLDPLRAQQRTARVGILMLGHAMPAKDLEVSTELARLGYVEGRNIAYDVRAAESQEDRLSELARQLVAGRPDVLIGATSPSAIALAAATSSIPIVITITIDPIETGLTASMARPSRNVTGFTSSSPTLAAKRLQLLHELMPAIRRVAYFRAPEGSMFSFLERHVRAAADALGISLTAIPLASEAGVAAAFEAAERASAQGVVVELNPNNVRLGAHIASQCLVRDLPSIHPWAFEAQAGALMSYGPAAIENISGTARYVDRLLKGAKISDLPFEEPTEIKFTVNLRTARSMKITVPQSLLARADEVID